MVKKNKLKALISKYKIDAIEAHIIASYLNSESLDFTRSPILKKYFDGFVEDDKLMEEVSALSIKSFNDLENHLELLIPDVDKKLNGAFFTPPYIVNFIINEIKPKLSDKNIDPSCGSGAFLIGLTNYYYEEYKKPIRDIIRENIYGIDILDYNINRVKILLSTVALKHGEELLEEDFNIIQSDSLKVDLKKAFSRNELGLFDNVVGNPPYVKFQDLSDENRKFLASNWETIKEGTFNLYFAFFELGYKILKKDGKLGYITPNNYFTSLAGLSLRKFFQKERCINAIIDFSHKKVFDVLTYTAITFLDRKENPFINFDRIEDDQKPEPFLKNISLSANYIDDLNSKKWRLLKKEDQHNIKQIETIGTPIGELFDISVGIATLKDYIYFVSGESEDGEYYFKEFEDKQFKIEKSITRPLFKISDFSDQSECNNNKKRIIFPYSVNKGKATVIDEKDLATNFPYCYEYLCAVKEILNERDKGRIIPFYAYGRTQGLTKEGIKLLTPTFSQNPKFMLCNDESALFCNGYGIYQKKKKSLDIFSQISPLSDFSNLDVISKILNSNVMHYYVSKTSVSIDGGYPCYQKNFIEKFTIPALSNEDIMNLRNTNDTDEINSILIDFYQLSLPSPNLAV